MLYVISTPIGNLQDLSQRAIKVLKDVDFVACEDTRHSKKMLSHFEIASSNRLISFHAGSKPEKIIKLLKEDKDIALISDAGTPAISDPGSRLIDQVHRENIKVSPIPGASAVISALSCSGFASNHFEFLGFIPHKKGREKLMKKIAEADHTVVFYESTHRIIKFLEQGKKFFPDKNIFLAREMTKIYEEFLRGKPDDILQILLEDENKQKGEFTIVVGL